jgi:hypothetical protein
LNAALFRAFVFAAALAVYPVLYFARRTDHSFYMHLLPLPEILLWPLVAVLVIAAWYAESRGTAGFLPVSSRAASTVFLVVYLIVSSALVVLVHRHDTASVRKFAVYHLSAWLLVVFILLHVALLVSAITRQVWLRNNGPSDAKA